MNKTLVLFAHPYFEKSKTSSRLIQAYQNLEHVTFRDLYEEYPDFNILTYFERKRLSFYSRIIFHFPLVWFGMPPLLKLWIDDVFDLKWFTNEKENNPVYGKKTDVVVTVDSLYLEYTGDEPVPFDASRYLTTLMRCIKINNMRLGNFITINRSNNLSEQELGEYYLKIKEIAKST